MTGVAPSEIMDDATLFAAFQEEASSARWTDLHELLAVNTEITHAVLCQLMANAGAKQNALPEPLRIPRPGDVEKKPRRVVSALDAALMLGGR